MLIDWTKHLSDAKEKQDFENSVIGARRVLNRLKALIEERELALDLHEGSVKQFDQPNWDYKQAFNIGLRTAYGKIKTIIDLDKQVIKEQ